MNEALSSCRAQRSRSWWLLLAIMTVTAAVMLPGVSGAHAPDQSYVFFRVYEESLQGRVEITITDLNVALNTSLREDGSVTEEELLAAAPLISAYVEERVSIVPTGSSDQFRITAIDSHNLGLGQYVRAHFEFNDFTAAPETVAMTYNVLFDRRPSHRGFAVIEHNWKSGTFNNEADVSLVFAPDSTQQVLQIDGSILQGFMAMIEQGAHHIWIGIDHILFLLALLLPAVVRRVDGRWVPVEDFKSALIYVVKVVTVFTVAHTITLSAAAMGAIRLPSSLVESIIALSIAIAAADILRNIFGKRIWWVVFVFGLFHGFGFASVLGDIGIGGEHLVKTLLGFNIGVELGQIAVVAGIFPVLYLLRKWTLYTRFILPVGAVMLITISLYWFIERGFGVDLPAGQMLNAVIDFFK